MKSRSLLLVGVAIVFCLAAFFFVRSGLLTISWNNVPVVRDSGTGRPATSNSPKQKDNSEGSNSSPPGAEAGTQIGIGQSPTTEVTEESDADKLRRLRDEMNRGMAAKPIDLDRLSFTKDILGRYRIGTEEATALNGVFQEVVAEMAELDRQHMQNVSEIEGGYEFEIPAYAETERDLESKFRNGVESILGEELSEQFLGDAGLQITLRKWYGGFGKVDRKVKVQVGNKFGDREYSTEKVKLSVRFSRDREEMYRYYELSPLEQLEFDLYPEGWFSITRDTLPAAFAHLATIEENE